MKHEGQYEFTFGYFFKNEKPESGKLIELPSGHDDKDRKQAALEHNIDFDYCILYYSDDKKNFFTNFNNEKEAIGTNKDSDKSLVFDPNTYKVKRVYMRSKY